MKGTIRAAYRKGIRLIFRNQLWGTYGNVNELGDIGRSSGKSYLFFLTVDRPGISLTGDRAQRLEEQGNFALSGALLTVLENPRETIAFATGRTHNRSRSPRCTASS